jgi:type II secretory pathway predicted ATPase ExeA
MNRSPFPYRDFTRAKTNLQTAIVDMGEPWSLLVGDTGTGKTALLRELKQSLDRSRFRVLYFSDAKRLRGSGLVKVVGEALRVRSSICHSVTFDRVQRTLQDDAQRILIWLDEAQELPEDTIAQARAIVESDIDHDGRVQVLLVGLQKLRATLQEQAQFWRRIMVRETITGLSEDEAMPFLEHHFEGQGKRLCERGLRALFERSKGAPGVMVPMYRTVLSRAAPKGKIEANDVEETLERWELP